MISMDTLAMGAPVAAFVILGLFGFAEYCWMQRAKRRQQLAAERDKISGSGSSTGAVDTRAAAE
jgi:hypothetical protein